MYNSDGTLRVKLQRKPGPSSSVSSSGGARSSKENCAAASNSPTASPKAAGLKSKVTSIQDGGSPLRAKSRPGSDMRARQNQGTLSLKDESTAGDNALQREVSDAKRKALYSSRVFQADGSGTPGPPAAELSDLKLREVTGHDIFNSGAPDEGPKRAVLGGVRKDPGGGSSLSMRDLHPGTPAGKPAGSAAAADGRHPGGKASFTFGW